MTPRLLLLPLVGLLFLGCDSKEPAAGSEPPKAKEGSNPPKAKEDSKKTSPDVAAKTKGGPSSVGPLDRYKRKSISSEAMLVGRKMTDGARMYMSAEQRISGPDGEEPWHKGDAVGMPVAAKDFVFPGGTSFSFTTHKEIPKGGEKAKLTLDMSDKTIAAVLKKGYVTFEPEMYFRYTYTTGPGVGQAATLTVKAEADFAPESTQVHTVTYKVTVNKEGEAVVGEKVTENEFQ